MRVWLSTFFWKREVIYIVGLWQDFSAKLTNVCTVFEIGECQIFCWFFKRETMSENDVGVLKGFASLGFGSNVCELVPSGTMPATIVSVPPTMLATMLVIGATVVAMVSTPVTGEPRSQPTAGTVL